MTPSENTPPAAERLSVRPKVRPFPWARTLLVCALIVILVLAAALWRQQQLVNTIGRDAARRYGEVDTASRDAQTRSRQALDLAQAATDKLAVMESRLQDAQTQQAALAQLYQDLSRGEDDWTLTEVEQILSIAAQQLQLAGNVQNSMAALQLADTRLARADRPQFTVVRRAIAQDLQRLHDLPAIDVSGLALKIDRLGSEIDNLPLLAAAQPSADAPQASDHPASASWWSTLRDGFLADLRDLVRVRRIDHPDALLIAPAQGAILRENLKLRLLNARLALLSRQDAAWQADLAEVGRALPVYFDAQAAATRDAVALLTQIQSADVSIQLPTINDSLAAVRSVLPRGAVTRPAQR